LKSVEHSKLGTKIQASGRLDLNVPQAKSDIVACERDQRGNADCLPVAVKRTAG
jgi:hypothetical protein